MTSNQLLDLLKKHPNLEIQFETETFTSCGCSSGGEQYGCYCNPETVRFSIDTVDIENLLPDEKSWRKKHKKPGKLKNPVIMLRGSMEYL